MNNSSAFMDNLRQLFAECDLDGSGSLGRDEFRELCTKIGVSQEMAEETFVRLDVDKNNQITFDEFASGFNQYKQATAAAATTTTSSKQHHLGTTDAQSSSVRVPPARFTASPSTARLNTTTTTSCSKLNAPVTSRARARATHDSKQGATMLSLGSTGSSSNLTNSTNLTGSGHFDSSTSCELTTQLSSTSNNNYEQQQHHITNHNIPPMDDVIVYSSDLIVDGEQQASGSGSQFGSMMSNSSAGGYSQVKSMQDLMECVQKLQNENQILTQIFFKDKREREEYISQLGEEFDHQLKEVEERANKRARDELENEKKRLHEMMQTERETLQHHYQTLEKISKMVKSPGQTSPDVTEGIDRVKLKLEDTFVENRQLKKSLLDTKTDVALIWKEMEKLKRQYEDKLSSAYEKQRETQHECDHIKKQLNLMKDSNRKLQDASDVITNYIADRVDPVIKVAMDQSGGGGDDSNSLNNGVAGLRLTSGSNSNSRRGSILSEYLNDNNNENSDDSGGDLESMASSTGGVASSRLQRKAERRANGVTADSRGNQILAISQSSGSEQQYLNVPGRTTNQRSDETSPEQRADLRQKESNPRQQEASGDRLQVDRRVASGSSELQQPLAAPRYGTNKEHTRNLLTDVPKRTHQPIDGNHIKADSVCQQKTTETTQQVNEDPIVQPADGPSKATFNIILVGDSFVGKSSFAARFIEGSFVQGLISNCSIDFKTKSYKVDDVNYTVNLWDTAGQERFRSITASYFRKADGIILMYDVTDKRSYLNVRNWMSTISDTAAENVAVLLVGNKIDLRKSDNISNCVPTEEGFRLAKEYEIVFLETSVKTGTNLLPSMGKLIRLIAKNNSPEEEDTDRIRLSDKGRTFNCMPKNC